MTQKLGGFYLLTTTYRMQLTAFFTEKHKHPPFIAGIELGNIHTRTVSTTAEEHNELHRRRPR